jgi:predicted neutral ceramidase superfamily lipid hydrolase
VSKKELDQALRHYKFVASPTSTNSSQPVTVGDINKLIDETAKLLKKIISTDD